MKWQSGYKVGLGSAADSLGPVGIGVGLEMVEAVGILQNPNTLSISTSATQRHAATGGSVINGFKIGVRVRQFFNLTCFTFKSLSVLPGNSLCDHKMLLRAWPGKVAQFSQEVPTCFTLHITMILFRGIRRRFSYLFRASMTSYWWILTPDIFATTMARQATPARPL